ncbi:MAG: glycosyltransferase [Patescibacteria group bacterium]
MKNTSLNHAQAFLHPHVSKGLIIVNGILLLVYFIVILVWFEISNIYLFAILLFGQAFYLWQCFSHLYTVWETNYQAQTDASFLPMVDVFITVAGEPVELVAQTVSAALDMDYPKFKVHILNDGYVAGKDNWPEINNMARMLGANPITRRIPGGAKAGNINHALTVTRSPFVVIFDADHVPKKDFLRKTIGYFVDENVGFVQTPQYYKNYKKNTVTRGAWDQQQIFFGTICMGKNRLNSVTMAGTNMVIRRDALLEVGGMCADNIAEDFITGMFLHEKGWKSVYVPEVLAEGLAPEDFLSYYKQQLRWTKGSLEVFINYNPLFRRGLAWSQRFQYLASAGYYLSGLIIFINSLLPLIFFYTGAVPFKTSTMILAIAFMPYIILTLFNLQTASNYTYSFRALSFSMSSWWIHIVAFFEVLRGKKTGFAITSKVQVEGNFFSLVRPHLYYIILTVIGILYSYSKSGITPSLTTNATWSLLYVTIYAPFMYAALPGREYFKVKRVSFKHKLAQILSFHL